MARAHRSGKLEMVASGYSKSCGLNKGIVVNPVEVVSSIRHAAEEVESKSSIAANCVVAGISGDHIKSHHFHGKVEVQGKHYEVTEEDMENAIRAASIPLFPESQIIHTIPQEFFINNHGGIKNPVGLAGSHLDVNLHVISCDSSLCQSFVNTANKAQIEVKRAVLRYLSPRSGKITTIVPELIV